MSKCGTCHVTQALIKFTVYYTRGWKLTKIWKENSLLLPDFVTAWQSQRTFSWLMKVDTKNVRTKQHKFQMQRMSDLWVIFSFIPWDAVFYPLGTGLWLASCRSSPFVVCMWSIKNTFCELKYCLVQSVTPFLLFTKATSDMFITSLHVMSLLQEEFSVPYTERHLWLYCSWQIQLSVDFTSGRCDTGADSIPKKHHFFIFMVAYVVFCSFESHLRHSF